mmetsp:Transcript_42632/g.110179  ORF Transcript_42632/g.110179 Transcript_42632/m.110179 type:complete len:259 (+) Transcript_42632:1268-2044(+)
MSVTASSNASRRGLASKASQAKAAATSSDRGSLCVAHPSRPQSIRVRYSPSTPSMAPASAPRSACGSSRKASMAAKAQAGSVLGCSKSARWSSAAPRATHSPRRALSIPCRMPPSMGALHGSHDWNCRSSSSGSTSSRSANSGAAVRNRAVPSLPPNRGVAGSHDTLDSQVEPVETESSSLRSTLASSNPSLSGPATSRAASNSSSQRRADSPVCARSRQTLKPKSSSSSRVCPTARFARRSRRQSNDRLAPPPGWCM